MLASNPFARPVPGSPTLEPGRLKPTRLKATIGLES